jgi:hypothetical protein
MLAVMAALLPCLMVHYRAERYDHGHVVPLVWILLEHTLPTLERIFDTGVAL